MGLAPLREAGPARQVGTQGASAAAVRIRHRGPGGKPRARPGPPRGEARVTLRRAVRYWPVPNTMIA